MNATRPRSLPALLAVVLLGWLAGCATPPQTLQLRQSPPTGLPPRVELSHTPFFPQTRYQCGPAALATVIGRPEDPASQPGALVEEVYVPALEGSLQAELQTAASRRGLLAVELDGRLDSLLRELAAGNPVLVLQNLGFGFWPFWHYAVVIGYDLQAQRLILRSGEEKRLQRGFSLFEKTWRRAGRWALVVTPPGRLPATAQREALLPALLLLDRNAPADAALAAWRQASRRWSGDFDMCYGLGNAAWRAGDAAGAVAAFTCAVEAAPRRAEAWNNLAHARLRVGDRSGARAAIERALRLAPGQAAVRDSYREITGSDPSGPQR
jgi:tetratricopeptide (TPR) repeat protein